VKSASLADFTPYAVKARKLSKGNHLNIELLVLNNQNINASWLHRKCLALEWLRRSEVFRVLGAQPNTLLLKSKLNPQQQNIKMSMADA